MHSLMSTLSLLDLLHEVPPLEAALLENLQPSRTWQPGIGEVVAATSKRDLQSARLACKQLRDIVDANARELHLRVTTARGKNHVPRNLWPSCSTVNILVDLGRRRPTVVDCRPALTILPADCLQRITSLHIASMTEGVPLKVVELLSKTPNLRLLDLSTLVVEQIQGGWAEMLWHLTRNLLHLEELRMPHGAIPDSHSERPLLSAFPDMPQLRRLHLVYKKLTAFWVPVANGLPPHVQQFTVSDREQNGRNITMALEQGRLESLSITGLDVASLNITEQARIAQVLLELTPFPPLGQQLPLLRVGALVLTFHNNDPALASVRELLQRAARLELCQLVVQDRSSELLGLLQCRPETLSVWLACDGGYLHVSLHDPRYGGGSGRGGAGGPPGGYGLLPTAADVARRVLARLLGASGPAPGAGTSGRHADMAAVASAGHTDDSRHGRSGAGSPAAPSGGGGGNGGQPCPQVARCGHVPRLLLLRGRRVAELRRQTKASLEQWLRLLGEEAEGPAAGSSSGRDAGPSSGGTSSSLLLQGYQLFPGVVGDALLLECSSREGALEEVERAVGRRAREARDAAPAASGPSSWLEALRVPSVEAPAGAPLSGLEGGRRVYLGLVEQELQELYNTPLGDGCGAAGGGQGTLDAGGSRLAAAVPPAGNKDTAATAEAERLLVMRVLQLAGELTEFPPVESLQRRGGGSSLGVPPWFS